MIYLDEPDMPYIPSTKGEYVKEFEKEISSYLGVSDCVAVNSGTSALHLALLACGIGRGDVVIVPAITFVATANAVLYTGAKVRIIDNDIETWELKNDYKKSDAIIPVCLYGKELKHNIPIGKIPKLSGIPYIICDYAEGIHLKPSPFVDYTCYYTGAHPDIEKFKNFNIKILKF